MNDCIGLFGKWFGHKFIKMGHSERIYKGQRPVYSLQATGFGISQRTFNGYEDVWETKFTYINSQCKRCGLIK